eukprot:scaffold361_cov248-Pinguiococcus_pyrenoidosus.AAC.9
MPRRLQIPAALCAPSISPSKGYSFNGSASSPGSLGSGDVENPMLPRHRVGSSTSPERQALE